MDRYTASELYWSCQSLFGNVWVHGGEPLEEVKCVDAFSTLMLLHEGNSIAGSEDQVKVFCVPQSERSVRNIAIAYISGYEGLKLSAMESLDEKDGFDFALNLLIDAYPCSEKPRVPDFLRGVT